MSEITDEIAVPDEDDVDETTEAQGVEAIEMAGSSQSAGRRQRYEASGEAARAAAAARQLSPNFNLSEFHCRDGTPVPDNTVDGLERLCVEVLQPLRDKFGVGTVSSGFRSKSHNEKVNGASRSYHRYDLRPGFAAADMKFRTGSPSAWADEADRILGSRGGVGRYSTFVHVDNRSIKWRA